MVFDHGPWVVMPDGRGHNFYVSETNTSNKLTVRIFYAASFVNSLASGVTGPLMVIYLLFVRLTPAQIGILLAAGRLAMIIFEFPTGVFADRYGKRKSLLISFALSSALFLGWFASSSFFQFFILSILSGLAYTFQSGAKESLMIDVLQLADKDNLRNRVFVRTGSWGNAGFVIGGILAALLSFFALRSIWLAAAVCNVVLFLLFLLGVRKNAPLGLNTEPLQPYGLWRKEAATSGISCFFTISKDAIWSLFSSGPLLRLLGVAVFFSFATAIYGLAYPVYFKQILNLPDYMFGVLGSVSAIVGIAGMFMGEKICAHRGPLFALRMFVFSLSLSFVALGFFRVVSVTIFVFVIIEALIHGWYPMYQSFFNKFVASDVRTSIISLQSVVSLMAIAGGELAAGVLISAAPPPIVIEYSSLLLLITLLLLIKMRPQKTEEKGALLT